MIGQGVNLSVEDAATLQVLLRNIKGFADLSRRMAAFEDIRLSRTVMIQILSPTSLGKEYLVADKLKPYLRGRDPILSAAARREFISEYG